MFQFLIGIVVNCVEFYNISEFIKNQIIYLDKIWL